MLLNINHIDDYQLKHTRFSKFNFSLSDCKLLQPRIDELYNELISKGFLFFKPKVYIGEEWCSIDGTLTIFIPFYLLHKRLIDFERKVSGKVEGSNKAWCMRLLRHEAGHCFDHAFNLSKARDWRQLFGNPGKRYDPDNYSIIKKSKNYVINLEEHYAQSHPCEDFAETFAVWLQYNKRTWTNRYLRWPVALSKLRYVDRIVGELRLKKPKVTIDEANEGRLDLRKTLHSYYNKRRT